MTKWKKRQKLIQGLYPNHMQISRPWRKHVQSFKKIGIKLYEELHSQAGLQKTDFLPVQTDFWVCKTDSVCIKRIFFSVRKTHFADHILAQLPGLVKCQTVNCP